MRVTYKPLVAGLTAMILGIWQMAEAVIRLADYYGW